MVREPHDEDGRTNWGPRLLAPLAFFAAVTVLVLLVQSSLGADPGTTTTLSTPNATLPGNTGTTTIGNPGKRKNYRIKEGDTLEAIAQRFDTTVLDLVALNPNIEANNLEPGTRIRIQ
jgi:LysM repeat protein